MFRKTITMSLVFMWPNYNYPELEAAVSSEIFVPTHRNMQCYGLSQKSVTLELSLSAHKRDKNFLIFVRLHAGL